MTSLIVIIIIRVILLDLNFNFTISFIIFIDAWALLSSLCLSFDVDVDIKLDFYAIINIINLATFHAFSYLSSALFLEHGWDLRPRVLGLSRIAHSICHTFWNAHHRGRLLLCILGLIFAFIYIQSVETLYDLLLSCRLVWVTINFRFTESRIRLHRFDFSCFVASIRSWLFQMFACLKRLSWPRFYLLGTCIWFSIIHGESWHTVS